MSQNVHVCIIDIHPKDFFFALNPFLKGKLTGLWTPDKFCTFEEGYQSGYFKPDSIWAPIFETKEIYFFAVKVQSLEEEAK